MPVTEEVIKKVAEDTGVSVEELKVSGLLAFLRGQKKVNAGTKGVFYGTYR